MPLAAASCNICVQFAAFDKTLQWRKGYVLLKKLFLIISLKNEWVCLQKQSLLAIFHNSMWPI